MKIFKLKNKNNEEMIPYFIKQNLDSNSKIEVPSIYAVNEKIKPKFLLAYLSSNHILNSAAWNQKEISLTQKENTTDNQLKINNQGKIIVGKNVSKLEISYSINLQKDSETVVVYGRLLKNSGTYHQQMSTDTFQSLSSTIMMSVKENDVISLGYMTNIDSSIAKVVGTDGTFFETYIYIKIIE